MKYLQLIRWPNLIIIAATMVLTRCFILQPVLQALGGDVLMPLWMFVLLVLSMVLIAAGGYVINDLSDADVDSVNKPDKMLIGKVITYHNAHFIYYAANTAVVLIAGVLGYLMQNWRLPLILIMLVGLLWFYSRRYKRMLLIGNVVVAAASAMTVVVVWLAQFFYLSANPPLFVEASSHFSGMIDLIWAYTGFSFLTSLVREMVKDIEDLEGDRRFGCNTLAVALGAQSARWVVQALLLGLLLLIVYWQYQLMAMEMMATAMFLVISLIINGISMFYLFNAADRKDDGRVSNLLKWLMVSGMASMLLLHL